MTRTRSVVAGIALAVLVTACGGNDKGDTSTTTPTTAPATATTVAPTTAAGTGDTTAGTSRRSRRAAVPGSPCTLGSNPDCVDPEGDGQGVYLIGGGQCMRQFPDSPGLCADLDGDGTAGYPDSG